MILNTGHNSDYVITFLSYIENNVLFIYIHHPMLSSLPSNAFHYSNLKEFCPRKPEKFGKFLFNMVKRNFYANSFISIFFSENVLKKTLDICCRRFKF